MKVMIIKKNNLNIEKEIEIIKNNNIEIVDEFPDFIISFGGDGTVLKAVSYAMKYNASIVPVNFGRVGYMADIEKEDFKQCIINLKNGEYNISERFLLECKIKENIYYSLNEIVFKYDNIGEIDLYDKDKKISSFRGDGLIISTATGSTAYAMSAGGSIIHPNLKVINIVSIASQHLSTRPLILPETQLIILSKAKIFIDGKSILYKGKTCVYYSNKSISIVEMKNKDYYYMLNRKLDWKG